MAYQSTNPFTGEVEQTFDAHTDEEATAALARADAAFRSGWSRGPIAPRLAVLGRLATLLEARADALAEVMASEMGKPLAQGVGEVHLSAGIARYYAENAEAHLAPEPIVSTKGEAWVEHHPIGVLLAVEPWNFPIYQLIRVIAPAIAVGNPVLFKHASIVPQCAALFEALVLEAGAPVGAVANLYITSSQVSDLIGDDRIQGVALTGSEGAGSIVAARTAECLKKSTMELGGSDVFVVLDDADPVVAARAGAGARLANAGQACTAAKRFVLQRGVADAFLRAFVQEFAAAVLGDPKDPATTVGPLSSASAVEGLHRQVENAVAHGAEILIGGRPMDRPGFFFEPTILTGVTRDNPAYFEEFFGPVAQIHIVEDDDAVVALANDSPYGLGGSIFSTDIPRARALASRIETGMVFINSPTRSLPELPFGGVKRSGYGRELGDVGIKEFVNRKLVVVAA